MYNWIYYKVYTFLESKGAFDARFNAVLLLFFMQLVHLLFFIMIVANIMSFDIPKLSGDHTKNKFMMFPFGIVWLYLTYLYFKKKHNAINSKYKGQILKTYQFLILVLFLIILPLYFAIKLSQK